MAIGRPREYDRAILLADFERYIEATDIPIVAEWACRHRIPRRAAYDWEEFQEALAWCLAKKEAALERECLRGNIDRAMAIFSLKQLGWKERTELSGDPQSPVQVLSRIERVIVHAKPEA